MITHKNLIIISSDEEIKPLLLVLPWKRVAGINMDLYQYKTWLLLHSKIGLISATQSMTMTLDRYSKIIENVIVLGSCGSLKKGTIYQINKPIFIDQATYLNANLNAFGYKLGETPESSKLNLKTSAILNKLLAFCLNQDMNTANIASSDQFVQFRSDCQWPLDKYNIEFQLIDMEAAAYIQTAQHFNKPIAVIKVISDYIADKVANSHEDYSFNIAEVANTICQLALTIINQF